MATDNSKFPASLNIDYAEERNQVTSFFRLILAIPILIVIGLLTDGGGGYMHQAGGSAAAHGGSILGSLAVATGLMIIFRQRYPRWWYNFALELTRFSARVGAYVFLLTDEYPSTVDQQAVHLDVSYPNAHRDLNRYLPIVKWLLAIPHYIVLGFLSIGVVFVTIYAWFVILFTAHYPRGLFDFVVGVGRWALRVNAYAFLLTTDEYPPFSLK